jgi:hypothetical protein
MNELSPRDRGLFQLAARAPGPTADDRARVRRALAAAAPLAGLGTVAAATKAAGATSGVLKTVVIFAAAAAVGSGVVVTVKNVSAPALPPPPARVVHAAAPPPSPAIAPIEPEPAPVVEPPVAPKRPVSQPPKRESPPPPAPEPVAAPAAVPAAAPPRCTLERELAVLKTVAPPAETLAALDAHERECPGGDMAEERRAARGLALCALGRKDEGRVHLRWLEHANPDSPALPRLRNACE